MKRLPQDQVLIPILKRVPQEEFKGSSFKDSFHKALVGSARVNKDQDHELNNFLRHKDIEEVPFKPSAFVIASSLSTIATFASSSKESQFEAQPIAIFGSTTFELKSIQDNKGSQAFKGILVGAFITEQVLSACNQAALGWHDQLLNPFLRGLYCSLIYLQDFESPLLHFDDLLTPRSDHQFNHCFDWSLDLIQCSHHPLLINVKFAHALKIYH